MGFFIVANNLVINLNKINIMKFLTHKPSHSALHIGHKERYKQETMNKTFLGLQSYNNTNWKKHFELMISKWNWSCCAFTSEVNMSKNYTLKSIYCVYYVSVINWHNRWLRRNCSCCFFLPMFQLQLHLFYFVTMSVLFNSRLNVSKNWWRHD